MTSLARPMLMTASLFALATSARRTPPKSCSAYPTGTAEKIESTDLASKFGDVPKPGKELHFAYVTKTLINEFWQDVAAGVKNEAAKYGIKVDVQAAKDESSMVEQLNLAQTVASQKPDALLLSPQSDSNLVPVDQGRDGREHPDGDHRRRAHLGRERLHRDRSGHDRRAGRDLPSRDEPKGRQCRPDRRRRWISERAGAHQGFQGSARDLSRSQARREPARATGIA